MEKEIRPKQELGRLYARRANARYLRVLAFLISAGFAQACVLLASAQATSYTYNGKIHFDIKRVPFSRFGSYLAISDTSDFEAPFQKRRGIFAYDA
jgi:hypothetical protein